MRQLWLNTPETIAREMSQAVKDGLQFNLLQNKQPPHLMRTRELAGRGSQKQLILAKTSPFTTDGEICRLVYQRPGRMTCECTCTALAESGQTLTVSLPAEIFEIQRRKYPRVATPTPSRVDISMDSQKTDTVTVADISMEGARLIVNGSLPPHLHQGNVIGPLTFTLHMRLATMSIDALTVARAQVVRTRDLAPGSLEIGLHFKISGEARNALEHYVQLRTIEDAAARGTTQKDQP